jgi:hypothetical protein
LVKTALRSFCADTLCVVEKVRLDQFDTGVACAKVIDTVASFEVRMLSVPDAWICHVPI